VRDDSWVPHVGEGEREGLYWFGFWLPGSRTASPYWAEGLPRAFYSFSISFWFSFSCFLFLFLSFAKMLQINSNHFQKFSKNQCNDLTLQENSFSELEQDFQKVS
jgi:hypothetical protein